MAETPNWGALCEVEVPEGLEAFARDELRRHLGRRVRLSGEDRDRAAPGRLRFWYTGELSALLSLGTVHAAYLVCQFPVPRPRALLADGALRAILAAIDLVRRRWPAGTFTTLRLSAAGTESAVMARLRRTLGEASGLQEVAGDGDLALRVRPSPGARGGWEVLVRLSPRPLTARSWRVCNLPGALDAVAARVMAIMTNPSARDVFLNLGCGSGTLLIERLGCAAAFRAIGCDINPGALGCAARNIAASGHQRSIDLHLWDARDLPLPDGSIDALCCDLPFGHLVGSHAENERLYPALLREAARVARAGAPLVLLTQEVRLLSRALGSSGRSGWRLERDMPVRLRGLPRRIVLVRRC